MARRPKSPFTLVLLVRHGTTPTTGAELPGRSAGLHLSEAGQAQAGRVAERIGALGTVGAVYASPLERTQETAAPIARIAKKRVRVARDLVDLDTGEWTGRRLSDLRRRKEWSRVQRNPSGFRFPGGESFTEMQARMVAALESITTRHRGELVVAVSHADPIRAVVAHALGTHLDLFQRLVVSPCSVSAIAYSSGGPTVLTVNNTDDLTALGSA